MALFGENRLVFKHVSAVLTMVTSTNVTLFFVLVVAIICIHLAVIYVYIVFLQIESHYFIIMPLCW